MTKIQTGRGELRVCAVSLHRGRHFFFTSFKVAHPGALLTLFISPMKEADELCLSSDMFSTCYAHSNGQMSQIMILKKKTHVRRRKVIYKPFCIWLRDTRKERYSLSYCLVWCLFLSLLTLNSFCPYPPDNVEDGWYEELIVDGHSHIARLVESRGDGSDSVAKVHAPQEEEELSCETKEKQQQKGDKEGQSLKCLLF